MGKGLNPVSNRLKKGSADTAKPLLINDQYFFPPCRHYSIHMSKFDACKKRADIKEKMLLGCFS
jgi:hypothetical protein